MKKLLASIALGAALVLALAGTAFAWTPTINPSCVNSDGNTTYQVVVHEDGGQPVYVEINGNFINNPNSVNGDWSTGDVISFPSNGDITVVFFSEANQGSTVTQTFHIADLPPCEKPAPPTYTVSDCTEIGGAGAITVSGLNGSDVYPNGWQIVVEPGNQILVNGSNAEAPGTYQVELRYNGVDTSAGAVTVVVGACPQPTPTPTPTPTATPTATPTPTTIPCLPINGCTWPTPTPTPGTTPTPTPVTTATPTPTTTPTPTATPTPAPTATPTPKPTPPAKLPSTNADSSILQNNGSNGSPLLLVLGFGILLLLVNNRRRIARKFRM